MEISSRPSHRRGGRNNPSFSSSLLDAIDRSIDEPTTTHSLSHEKPVLREAATYPNHRRQSSSSNISTSSNSSSFGGSEADSIVFYRPKPIRTTIVHHRSELPPPPPEKKKTTKVSIRGRIHELRTTRKTTLATFLNGLFSGTGITKKHKAASVGTIEESSSGSCFTKSSRTSSCGRTGGEPAMRNFLDSVFSSSAISMKPKIDELVCPSMGPVVDRSKPFKSVGGGKETRMTATERRRIVEEMMREIDDGGESDSSEDLFEIESLVRLGGGGWRDELPVFGTTDFEINRAIARGVTL